jgi:hypothetical protein
MHALLKPQELLQTIGRACDGSRQAELGHVVGEYAGDYVEHGIGTT